MWSNFVLIHTFGKGSRLPEREHSGGLSAPPGRCAGMSLKHERSRSGASKPGRTNHWPFEVDGLVWAVGAGLGEDRL